MVLVPVPGQMEHGVATRLHSVVFGMKRWSHSHAYSHKIVASPDSSGELPLDGTFGLGNLMGLCMNYRPCR